MSNRVQDSPTVTQVTSANDPLAPGKVLKHRNLYAIFDALGDIDTGLRPDRGLYLDCTRFLSRFCLRLQGLGLVGLSSSISSDNSVLFSDLTNAPSPSFDGKPLKSGSFYIHREALLYERQLHEKLTLQNETSRTLRVTLAVEWKSDFMDLFEVRGCRRPARGERIATDDPRQSVYRGRDDLVRLARIQVHAPQEPVYHSGSVEIPVVLPPHGNGTILLEVSCEIGETPGAIPVPAARIDFRAARSAASSWTSDFVAGTTHIHSNNDYFQGWIDRSWADINLLLSETEHGLYPFAGVPWFCAPFGRDALITARQLLSFAPSIARGVLSYLAAHQATETNPLTEAEPGKILHESRRGEMANLGEIPYAAYYGTADAPALFLTLLGEYVDRTGDLEFLKDMRTALELSLEWLENQIRENGFVIYSCANAKALLHQGWKDADDAVPHADGTLAHSPFALCEIQAYAFSALTQASRMMALLGYESASSRTAQVAADLRERFSRDFWLDDLGAAGCFTLALANGRPCRVVSSNAGQVLASGIASPEQAIALAKTLQHDSMFGGWGVRTLATSEKAYNPLSYHNGSVWPHDNSLIAAGLARYGRRELSSRIFHGMFQAARFFDFRLPELFAGFEQRKGVPPIQYPNACSPQAWAAGTPFLMLEAALGLTVDGFHNKIVLHNPWLPPFLRSLEISNFPVGNERVHIHIAGASESVDLSIVGRYETPISVEIRNQSRLARDAGPTSRGEGRSPVIGL